MEAQHMVWAHSMPVCSGVKVLNVSVKSCWIISMPPPQRTWRWRISHMLPCQIFGSCFAAWFAPCLRLQRSLLRPWRTMATKQWPWDGLFWKAFSYRLSWDWVDLHPLSQVYFDLFCPSTPFLCSTYLLLMLDMVRPWHVAYFRNAAALEDWPTAEEPARKRTNTSMTQTHRVVKCVGSTALYGHTSFRYRNTCTSPVSPPKHACTFFG